MVFYSCLGVFVLAALGLAGWLLGLPALGALFPGAVAMAPATAALFALLALAALGRRAEAGARGYARALVIACLAFAALNLLGHAVGRDASLEEAFVSRLEQLLGRAAARISPATDVFFLASCLGLLFHGHGRRNGPTDPGHAAGILGGVICVCGLTIFLGYLVGQPLLYGSGHIPVAASTALGFVCLGAALAALAGPERLPMRLFVGGSVRARLMRALVPAIVLTLVANELADIYLEHVLGLNDALLLAAEAVGCASVVGAVVFRIGHFFDVSLATAENARLQAKRVSDEELAFNAMILSHAPFGISLFDGETGQCVRVNKTMAAIEGGPLEQILSQNFRELAAWKVSGLRELAEKTLAENRSQRLDLEYASSFGQHRRLDCTLARFEIESWPYLLLIAADIGRRKAMEAELGDKLRFIQTLMDAAATPIYFKDLSGRYQGCNKATEELLGIPRERMIGRTVHELFPPEQARIYFDKDEELIAKGGTQTYESTLVAPGGTVRDILFHKALYQDSQKRTQGLIGIITDITDRKRAEREARENEVVLRKILSGIRAGICIIDPVRFTIMEVNAVAAEIIGLPSAYFIGKPWRDIGWRDKSGTSPAGMACSLEARGCADRELFIERPDGRIVPIMKTIITADQGGKFLIFEVFFDISEQKALERQLAMAQKLESLGGLAAGIAHEINTPVQYIGDNLHFLEKAFADILELGSLCDDYGRETTPECRTTLEDLETKKAAIDFPYYRDEIPKAVSQALEGVKRVAGIVLAMKKFSHPGAEEKVGTDLNEAVETTVLVSRNEWKYVADVDLDLDRNLPQVFCLPGDVNQVLLNILVNAAHAIADKVKGTGDKGRIAIRTSGDGEYFTISIGDTGSGIPPANLDKIFDPFFTTKPVGKGTGQGLAIAHNIIVEKHGGTIAVESELGRGATFLIRLPFGGPHLAQDTT
jgi:PAS domain S-box-containing protein